MIQAAVLCSLISGITPVAYPQDGFRVDYVHFEGNAAISAGQLREQMTLKGFNWIQEKILGKSSSQFHADILANDLKKIRRFYQRRGFLSVDLSQTVIANPTAQSVGIVIAVREGPPITVSAIDWMIASPSTQDSLAVDSLLSRMKPLPQLGLGMRFQDRLITADADSTNRYFANHGFPYAQATSELSVDTIQHIVRVLWKLSSGPQCVFGKTSITGATRSSETIITRQLTFAPGEIFRQSQLDHSQQQLIELGLFEVATVTGELDMDRHTDVPVRITLREAPRLSSKLGFGYGREDDFRIFTDSRLLGVLGGARRLELYAKHSGLEPYHVRLRLTQPAFLSTHTSASLSPFIRRQHEPGFTLRRHGITAGLDHQVSSRLNLSAEYGLERVSLDTTSVAEAAGVSGLTDLYNKSSITLTSTYDNSRPTFYPNHGNFVALSTKWSGLGLGSQYHFVRTTLDWRHYEGLLGLVVATRIRIGGIHSYDDDRFVPVEDRYFSGGSTSLRGWVRGEVGPEQDGTPEGGASLIETSLEFRIPVWGIMSAAVFGDAGNVWRESYFYDLRDLRYSIGAGLRMATPIGPVRLDLARPVGEDDVSYELHINVGQAF